jgi:hypothetical protein
MHCALSRAKFYPDSTVLGTGAYEASIGRASPHNFSPRVEDGRRGEGRQCRSHYTPSRLSRRTSPRASGARCAWSHAHCTLTAAVPSPVMGVTRARRRRACASRGGTARKVIERSACCRTSLPPSCLAC